MTSPSISFRHIVITILFACFENCTGAERDANIEYECFGWNCPTVSLPLPLDRSYSSVPCNGTEALLKDPNDCHCFYYCPPAGRPGENISAIHYQCSQGYGFHEDWSYCVPEHSVRNCSAVYCPAYIYDGVIPDPKGCTSYYRCTYGFATRYKCPKGSAFHSESGLCRDYQEDNAPACVQNNTTIPPTTTTTDSFTTITVKNNETTTQTTTTTNTTALTIQPL